MAAAAVLVSHDHVFKEVQKVMPDCIAADEVDELFEIVEGKISETVKVFVETAVRYYVVQNLCRGSVDISKITAVAKLSADLARKEACLPTLPILVLSDAFDSLTVPQCEQLFSFVESNVALWKEPMFFTPCKNQVLRMCNDVLRRLSRSQNTSFCGRILLFLARYFPFSERSGLNLISEFNLENVTNFTAVSENDESGETKDVEMVDIDDEKPASKDPAKPSEDSNLHAKFWALQDFFRNPAQCYVPANMTKFSQYTADVLAAFSSFKLDSETHASAKKAPVTYDITEFQENMDDTILDSMPDANKTDQYFAKFLTNKRLLDLQFSDSNFRRYFLVQILILCHYLTSKTRFKLPREKLSKVQEDYVRGLEVKVFGLLRETPPDGDTFVAILIKLLKREDLWSTWKDEGCKEVEKPESLRMDMEEEVTCIGKKRKRNIGEQVKEEHTKKKVVMANAEMTRLWNICPDNREATRQKRRDFTPSLENYFKKSIGQVTGDVPIKESLVSDENFGWRALRILACRSPHFFTHSTSPIATLPEYLTSMVRKLARDMPQYVVQKTDSKDEDSKDDSKVADEDVKMISDETQEQVDETVDDQNDRPELSALTTEEQAALADKLGALTVDKWKPLTRKLGFGDDDVDYFLKEQKKSARDTLIHFLALWVENEGEEANKESILYTLGGLKLSQYVEGAI